VQGNPAHPQGIEGVEMQKVYYNRMKKAHLLPLTLLVPLALLQPCLDLFRQLPLSFVWHLLRVFNCSTQIFDHIHISPGGCALLCFTSV
jgi:hypothetical protein